MPYLDFLKQATIKYYTIPITCLFWLIIWISFLISTDFNNTKELKIYLYAQSIIAIVYLCFGSFLERGISFQICGYARFTWHKQGMWDKLIEVDVTQRIIFLILGSGWFSKTYGTWPFFILTREQSKQIPSLGHFVRAHLIISTFLLVIELFMLLDHVYHELKQIGVIELMDTINPTFWIRFTSITWGILYVISFNSSDMFTFYAALQMGFTLFYFVCSFGLSGTRSFTVPITRWEFDLEPGFVLLVLLIIDFLRRIVFICMGTLWFVISTNTTPIEYILQRGVAAFTDFDFHLQVFLWHFVFSIIMLFVDMTMFGMILYYIISDDPIEIDLHPINPLPPFKEMFKPFQGEQEVCSICHDGHDETTYTTQVCGHSFHRDCIQPWLERNLSCPLCRSNLIFVIAVDQESIAPAAV